MQGAGIQSAQTVADHYVDWVLTSHVGTKTFQALQRTKVKIGSSIQKTCREALTLWKNGGYKPLVEADVTSHWG